MEKLDNCIKTWNLIFTDTLKSEDLCTRDFNLSKSEVNYQNCISLYNLVYAFNKLYLAFKKEYNELEKIEMGRSIEIVQFKKFSDEDGKEYRTLIIDIDEPTIINQPDTLLYLRDIDGQMETFVTNNLNPFDKNYYFKYVSLDNEKVKKYLDLFEKYKLLLELYYYLRMQLVFGDGSTILQTKINDGNSNLFDNLENSNITMASLGWLSANDEANISIHLGDNFDVDSTNSSLILDGVNMDTDASTYTKILQSVYINGQYLSEYKDRNKDSKNDNVKPLMFKLFEKI